MGLLKILLGFDRGDLARLEERVKVLEEENKVLREELEKLVSVIEALAAAQASNGSEGIVVEAGEVQDGLAGAEDDDTGHASYDSGYTSGDQGVESATGDADDAVDYSGEDLSPGQDSSGDEEIVLGVIASGVTSPSEIIEVTGLSKHRVYAALKELSEKGVIVKRREGRRVHYLLADEAPGVMPRQDTAGAEAAV